VTPEQRQMRASAASHAMWANTADRTLRTAPARRAAMARFERQVDPDGVLPDRERAVRAESARKAYFKALALRSSITRAKRRNPTSPQ
jgi:hypothetical protein